MRKILLEHLQPGSILAKPVYHNDLVLLNRGTILTRKYIERLKKLGFTFVYVDDGFIDDVVLDEIVSQETRERAASYLQQAISDVKNHTNLNVSSLKNVISEFIDEITANRDMMLSLNDIYAYDNYTFTHSINVTVIAMTIGMCLYYNNSQLMELGLGVLLHDVGKVKIPTEIINKPGKLTEEEYAIVKKHSELGFEMLRVNPEIKITSAHVAFQHHERFNGTGYPRGLAGKNIIEIARIAAIADVYDAMGNDRCYRQKYDSNAVYNYLAENSGTQFDPYILDRFIQKVAIYPKGVMVVLNDGRIGFVINQNMLEPKRPVVRLFWECDGTDIPKPIEINLLFETQLSIFRTVDGTLEQYLSLAKSNGIRLSQD